MNDEKIVELYWARSEEAIAETAIKYGNYCFCIANGILHNNCDSEECVSDTYMKAWNSMPEARPSRLSPYLGRITRNLAINRYKSNNASKRGGTQVVIALEELKECLSSRDDTESVIDNILITQVLNGFLGSLRSKDRMIFIDRYFNVLSIKDIAGKYDRSESYVKVSLFRSRKKLANELWKNGIIDGELK